METAAKESSPENQNPWPEALTFEEFVKLSIQNGTQYQVLALIRLLPASKKEYYRQVWKRCLAE